MRRKQGLRVYMQGDDGMTGNSAGPEVRSLPLSPGSITSLRGGICFDMATGSWSSLYLQSQKAKQLLLEERGFL